MQAGPPASLIVLLVLVALCALGLTYVARGEGAPRRPTWSDVESCLGLFCMVGMLCASAAQVIVRYGLSDVVEIPWTEEFSRLLLVWAAMWGAAMVQRTDDHIAMTVVYDWLPAPLRLAVLCVSDVVSLVVLGVIAWYGWSTVQRQMGMSTVSLGMPISVFILPVALAATIMIVHTLVLIGRRLRGLPVGPPASLDATPPV
jgi:TRAP-type C4-dicarboxylate transport system permease small subunit